MPPNTGKHNQITSLAANAPTVSIDYLGLTDEYGPIPDGEVHIDPGGGEHNNYISWWARCPKCYEVSAPRVDYGAMNACLYAAKARETPGWDMRITLEMYENYVLNRIFAGDYGIISQVVGVNCEAYRTRIDTYMRTRLVSPTLFWQAYREAEGLPNDSDAVECYRQSTKVYFKCKKCE